MRRNDTVAIAAGRSTIGRLAPMKFVFLASLALTPVAVFNARHNQTATTLAGTWALVLERPIGGKYEDLAFPDSADGWVVSARGDILHTADGGRTWAVQANGIAGLRSVDFIDRNRGFAGTLTGRLYRTDDGGKTWMDISDRLPRAAKGICGITHFASSVHVVGRYAGGVADYFSSQDGGKTWRDEDLRTLAQGLVDVAFVSDSIGLIGGIGPPGGPGGAGRAIVLKTIDRGRTWRTVFEGADDRSYVWKLFPISTKMVYAALQSEDGTYRIAKTTDGGDHWDVITVATQRPSGPGIQGVGFIDENNGWVGGFFSGMYATTDGGRTWTKATMKDALINRYRRVGRTLFTAGTRGVLRYDPASTK